MKKYKLKKEYPGSPKLGIILEFEKESDNKYRNYDLNIFEPENYPEFWEEIVEKDYEILSLISRDPSTINTKVFWYFDKENNGWTVDEPERTYHKEIPSFCKIHSVKRLSDGEIFTVGDKVNSTISDLGRDTDITGFKLIDNKLKVGLRDLGYYPLSTIILPKKPLFTTEDGVDIYEGDKYFTISSLYQISPECIICDWYGPRNPKWYFSTKEAAEEYILMNKPCLSFQDIINYSTTSINAISLKVKTRELKKFIKNKL